MICDLAACAAMNVSKTSRLLRTWHILEDKVLGRGYTPLHLNQLVAQLPQD